MNSEFVYISDSYVLAKLSLSYPLCGVCVNGVRGYYIEFKIHMCVCTPSQDKCDCIKQLSAVA